jgi:hypothetical protein
VVGAIQSLKLSPNEQKQPIGPSQLAIAIKRDATRESPSMDVPALRFLCAISLIAGDARQVVAYLLLLLRFLLLPNLRLQLLPDSEKCFPHVGLKAGSVLKRRVEDRFHDHAFFALGTGDYVVFTSHFTPA